MGAGTAGFQRIPARERSPAGPAAAARGDRATRRYRGGVNQVHPDPIEHPRREAQPAPVAPPELDGEARRVFLANVVVNAVLAVAKLLVGWLARSPALLADGWHSIGDVFTTGALWFAFGAARKPPDEDHHYGHGNFEALGGLVAGIVIGLGGVAVVLGALSSDVVEIRGGPTALAMAFVSVVANLWLVRITRVAARERSSPTLTSLERDNVGDFGTGLLVFVGVGCTALGWPIVERFVAVLIGALVVKLGWSSAREGFDVLMDRVADPELRGQIERAALATKGVRGVQAIRVHPIGSAYRVDLEIAVAGDRTVREGHAIAHDAERAITENCPRVVEVHVHVNPASDAPAGPLQAPDSARHGSDPTD